MKGVLGICKKGFRVISTWIRSKSLKVDKGAEDEPWAEASGATLRLCSKAAITGMLLCSCSTVPANKPAQAPADDGVMNAVMARKDRIICLSPDRDKGQPVLLLLHGATDDPTEMMDIARQWRGKYDVYLYSYNYHQRVEKVGHDFVNEIKRLQSQNALAENATVIVFSYSAVVFREAVIGTKDNSLFSGMSLIQLVPTAGGSHQAKWMCIPIFGPLAAWASKPSDAENPYGNVARKLWGGAGNAKFYQVIPRDRVFTILLEQDSHSLANAMSKRVRQRYLNGIGTNVVVIPEAAGVNHEYFPTNPTALLYLKKMLERTPGYAEALQYPTASADRSGVKISPGVTQGSEKTAGN